MHRRLMLTVAMKIDDRKENENFIAVDEANEANETNETKKTNEEKVNDIRKCLKKTFILIVSLIFMTSNLTLNSRDCLTKILLTIVTIVVFNF